MCVRNSYQYTSANMKSVVLSRYAPLRKIRAVKNLLSAANETEEAEEEDVKDLPIVSYYAPNLTLAVTNEPHAVLNRQAMTPPVMQHVTFAHVAAQEGDPEKLHFYPTLFAHEFWMLKEHMNPLNETVE